MRLIGDVNDKAPAEPGDLRIVRRAGEGFEEYRIEKAEERPWGLRWLGLRWVPFLEHQSGPVDWDSQLHQVPYLTLDAARRTADEAVAIYGRARARFCRGLAIEAATPVPCSWGGPTLSATLEARPDAKEPAAPGVRGYLFEARIICSATTRDDAEVRLRGLLATIIGPRIDSPAALYSLRAIDPPVPVPPFYCETRADILTRVVPQDSPKDATLP